MWRARFVVVYAAANAAAIAISGAAVCGLHLQWFVSIAVLAFAMATLQTLVLVFTGLRVSAVRWWPLTFGGTASVSPLAFGVAYVFGVILLGGLSTLGVTQGTEAVAALVFMLPAAFASVFVAGLQFFAFRSPPDNLLVVWFGANALGDWSVRRRSRTSRSAARTSASDRRGSSRPSGGRSRAGSAAP